MESDKGRKLAAGLDKDIVLAEGRKLQAPHSVPAMLTFSFAGYKQYDTGRTYMARMGDWRDDKDVELALDGIGGVNILVKADVHRSGQWLILNRSDQTC